MPERVLIHRWFAATYGWTPDQVGDLDLDDLLWLPVIEEAAHEAQEFLSKQNAKASQGPRRG